jgi:7-cyano-7-deazaguanine reductase
MKPPSAMAKKPAPSSSATPPPNQRQAPANPPSAPSKDLQVFPNPAPERDYVIQFQVPEFTCHCPLTGQPDFAHFTIDMIADKLCVELKSLKMYFWSYRNEGAFHEKVTNTILDDIVRATRPRFIRITARWYVRGGIYTNVVAEHRRKGWKPQPAVDLPSMPMERGLLG